MMSWRFNKRSVLFIVLMAFAAYSFFLYAKPPAAAVEPDKLVENGKVAWQKYNCNACHQVYGLGGYLGPDLTNVYAKGTDYIRAFLTNGTAVMPNFNLSDEEMENLLAYFNHLNRSGNADPRTFKILANGSITQ